MEVEIYASLSVLEPLEGKLIVIQWSVGVMGTWFIDASLHKSIFDWTVNTMNFIDISTYRLMTIIISYLLLRIDIDHRYIVPLESYRYQHISDAHQYYTHHNR